MAKFIPVRVEKTQYGSYSLHYYSPDGCRKRLSVGKDEKYAHRLRTMYEDWLLEGKDPEREIDRAKQEEQAKSVTARDFFPDFMDGHGSKRAEKTRASYRDSWRSISRYHELVDIRLGDLTPDLVEKYIYTRQEREGVSSNTVRIEFRMLSKMLGYAVRKGILSSNPLHGRVELPPKPSKREVRLTDDEFAALLSELKETSALAIFEFARASGRRKEEILSLRIENVQYTDIPEPGATYSVQVKGGDWKRFKASDWATEVLRRAIGRRREGYVFENPRTGRRYVTNARIAVFHKAVKKLGLVAYRDGKPVKMTFHDLRHVFATDLTDKRADIRDVQALMGHKSVTVTESYTADSRGTEALKLQHRSGA